MSKDGKSLYVDALEYDTVERFVLDGKILKKMKFDQVTCLLSCIAALSANDSNTTLLGSISRILLLSTQQSCSEWKMNASTWFCQFLSHRVFTLVKRRRTEQFADAPKRYDHPEKTNDAFMDWLRQNDKTDSKQTDHLIKLFVGLQETYRCYPWPSWAKLMTFDCLLHKEYLRSMSCKHTEPQDLHNFQHAHASEESQKQHPEKKKGKQSKKGDKPKVSLGPEFEPANVESFAHLSATAQSALVWRKIFVTTKGDIGVGPKWLSTCDTVIVVAGAPVPYAFTPLRVDLSRREADIREAVDRNEVEYNKKLQDLGKRKKKSILRPIEGVKRKRNEGKLERLEKNWGGLQDKLERLSNPRLNTDGWTLQGELYIEGIMDGEAMRAESLQKIMIV